MVKYKAYNLFIVKYHVFMVKYLYVSLLKYLQCEAPKIAKLVYNSNNYGLWYANS